MTGINLIFALPIALLVASAIYRRLRRRKRSHSLPHPPGPKGYPIIGNVLDIPRGPPLWEGSLTLGRQYSESTTQVLDKNHLVNRPRHRHLVLEPFREGSCYTELEQDDIRPAGQTLQNILGQG